MTETEGMEPCSECPSVKLDLYLLSIRGRQLSLAMELDRYKELIKFTLTPHDVNYFEALLLGIIAEERDRYQEDVIRGASKQGDGGQ